MGETKRLKRKLNEERRAATRQLSRDASVVQQLKAADESKRRVARASEKKRVSRLMEVEKTELAKLKTESGGGMDTSLGSYSSTKARKKANPRVGGNAAADGSKAKAFGGGPSAGPREPS